MINFNSTVVIDAYTTITIIEHMLYNKHKPFKFRDVSLFTSNFYKIIANIYREWKVKPMVFSNDTCK